MKRMIAVFFLAALALSAQVMPLNPTVGQAPMRTGNVATDTATLTPGQMSSLLTATPTAAATLTTPTATQMCALYPTLKAKNATNYWYFWIVKNTSAGANTITVAGGTNMTVVGTATIAQNAAKIFAITLNCAALTGQVISIGSLTF